MRNKGPGKGPSAACSERACCHAQPAGVFPQQGLQLCQQLFQPGLRGLDTVLKSLLGISLRNQLFPVGHSKNKRRTVILRERAVWNIDETVNHIRIQGKKRGDFFSCSICITSGETDTALSIYFTIQEYSFTCPPAIR